MKKQQEPESSTYEHGEMYFSGDFFCSFMDMF